MKRPNFILTGNFILPVLFLILFLQFFYFTGNLCELIFVVFANVFILLIILFLLLLFFLNNPFWRSLINVSDQWVQIRFRMAWLGAVAVCLPLTAPSCWPTPSQAPGEMTLLGTEFLPVNEVILQDK